MLPRPWSYKGWVFCVRRDIIARLVAQFPDWLQGKQDLAWFDQQIAALKD